MWVFGYGSLMWDDWEKKFGCLRKSQARASGFSRTFNKKSIRNWGSKEQPGPTLNLKPAPDRECVGIAFQFPHEQHDPLMAYLRKREGGFAFDPLQLALPDGAAVEAIAPIYRGKNLMPERPIAELAKLVSVAKGTSGACSDYVKNIAAKLAEMNITDPAVIELAKALD